MGAVEQHRPRQSSRLLGKLETMKKKIGYTVTDHAQQLRCALVFFLVVYALGGTNAAFAQFLDQAAITGTVQDSSGAVIAGAVVKLEDPGTGFQLTTAADKSGV